MPRGILPDPESLPTVEYLRECFDYCHETGVLIWKERPREHFATGSGQKNFNSQRTGRRIEGKQALGYISLKLTNRMFLAHRVIWAIYYGSWPTGQIDHINMDKSDNRIVNLKAATHAENRRRTSTPSNNCSGAIGVSWYKQHNKWRAYINVNGRRISLGCFIQKEDAIAARRAAEVRYGYASNHGETNPTKITPTMDGCVQPNNTSGVSGCCWRRTNEKWEARLGIGGKRIHLGSFDTLEEAAAARRAAEIQYGVTNPKGRGKVALEFS